MTSIDERVVSMKFDNKQFEQGVKTTLTSLDALNKGLKIDGGAKGLSSIAAGIDNLSEKFRSLSVIGITALANIANKAVNVGLQLAKSLTIDPIKAGLSEYETNLNSIQTILSNTQWQNSSLADVNKALEQLNLYSDQTIYNFSEMARNIGTFTAAGVGLQTSVDAIKGIANLAAISGSSSLQASTAMYQLSQALATGKVALMDWNSVVNAGMGGKVFQDALMETARVHGVAIDDIIKKQGSFRDSLQTGWLTSSILTETLQKFTGDLTASQLKAMGYNDQQIAGILKMGQTAQDAATKVKTFSQLINTLQEAAGSGWAKTWQTIFGDFDEAKAMFTNVNNVLGGFITASADARNKVLGDWKELGGRTVIIEAIANAFNVLIAIIKPIKDAFREIFPATTGKQLYDLSVAIRDFTENLKIGADTSDKLKRTFAGIFAVFGVGWDIIKQVAGVFANLFGIAMGGSGSILEITARIGDFLVSVHKAIDEGNGLTRFFEGLEKVLAIPIKLLSMFAKILVNVLDGAKDIGSVGLENFEERFAPLGKLGELINVVWTHVFSIFKTVAKVFSPLAREFSEFFSGLTEKIESSISDINYNTVLDSINTGLLAGIVILLKKFLSGSLLNIDVGGGVVDTIKNAFGSLTDTLSAMQANLKANTLIKIAGAIALLTASLVALSMIDSAKLTSALSAMAVMFTELMGSLAVFEKISGFAGFAKMPFVAASMILLAVAVDLLTIAVKKLADLDWESLGKGLAGLTVILGELVAVVYFMPDEKKLVSTGLGLIILAGAVKLLADSVADLSGLSWEEMAKGLLGVGALLASLTLFTKFSEADKGGLAQGAGILLLATGIKILASALIDMSSLSWEGMAKGLVATAGGLGVMGAALALLPPSSLLSAAGIFIVASSLGMISDALGKMGEMSWSQVGKGLTSLAGALGLIAVALALLPPTSLLSAAAIFVVASSLGMISNALGTMGGMSWPEIAKGLITLAGALAIIAGGLYLMTGALPGAAALLVVAFALAVLAPVLQMFSNMSWEEMGKGLLMLAGVFVVLGAAGLLLAPLVPTLLGLGIAITLLGVGLMAAGAGVFLFATGLTLLATAGTAAVAAIVAIVSGLIGLIPMVMEQIGLGLIAFAEVIATAGPSITQAITVVLLALITAIETVSPRIISTLAKMLVMLLQTLANAVPKMVDAGLKILTGILTGIANNIGKIVTAATNIITNFLNGISNNLSKVIQAGVNLIISFIEGLAQAIRNNSERMGKAGADLATAIIEGMARGLSAGASRIVSAAKNVASSALKAAMNVLGIHSPSKAYYRLGMLSDIGMANGLDAFGHVVSKAAKGVSETAIKVVRNSMAGMSDVISNDADIQPTITPVLDLTNIKNSSDGIDKLINSSTSKISVSAAYRNANDIYRKTNETQTSVLDQPTSDQQASLIFNQYNSSPKSLSESEIYRQTKNQLSVVKEVLK